MWGLLDLGDNDDDGDDGEDDDDDDFVDFSLREPLELLLFLCDLCSMTNFRMSILASSAFIETSLGLLCSLIIGDFNGSFFSFLTFPSCVRFTGVCTFLPSVCSTVIGFGKIVCFSL